jgi:hypothetical protein
MAYGWYFYFILFFFLATTWKAVFEGGDGEAQDGSNQRWIQPTLSRAIKTRPDQLIFKGFPKECAQGPARGVVKVRDACHAITELTPILPLACLSSPYSGSRLTQASYVECHRAAMGASHGCANVYIVHPDRELDGHIWSIAINYATQGRPGVQLVQLQVAVVGHTCVMVRDGLPACPHGNFLFMHGSMSNTSYLLTAGCTVICEAKSFDEYKSLRYGWRHQAP